MAAVKVSVVALRHVCCCPGAIRDRPGPARLPGSGVVSTASRMSPSAVQSYAMENAPTASAYSGYNLPPVTTYNINCSLKWRYGILPDHCQPICTGWVNMAPPTTDRIRSSRWGDTF